MKKLNTEQVMLRFHQVHGNLYSYQLVEYKGSVCKVEIICLTCKDSFKQRPHDHMQGKGCLACSGSKPLTNETFALKALKVHGNKYCYAEANIVNNRTTAAVFCIKCQETFWQRPYDHLRGQGCPECAGKKPLTNESFVLKALKVHGDKYEYSGVILTGNKTKVKIFCVACQETFEQRPDGHLQGKGCSVCSGNSRLTSESFRAKARKVHGGKYGYEGAFVTGSQVHVSLVCSRCQKRFWQTPNNHLQGHGCPVCTYHGFSKERPAILYYLKVQPYGNVRPLYKIGITRKAVKLRFTPTELKLITVLKTWSYEKGETALTEEKRILKQFKPFQYLGEGVLRNGNTELFTKDVLSLDCIIR